MPQTIRTFLMFQNGQASAALEKYAALVPGAEVRSVERYGADDPGPEGTVFRAFLLLGGQEVQVTDSPVPHDFGFTPSMSFFIECDSAEQVDEALVMHNYDVEKTLNAIWENDGKPLGDGTRSLLSGGPSAPRVPAPLSATNSPRFAPAQLPATAGVKAGVNVMSREALGLAATRGQRPAMSR